MATLSLWPLSQVYTIVVGDLGGVSQVAGVSPAMTAVDPPVGVTTTLSLKTGGEAQLVVAVVVLVPLSGPPLLCRDRPLRGPTAAAEAAALSSMTRTNGSE